MGTLSKTATRCKCGQLSPLRAARVKALLNYLDYGSIAGTIPVSWYLYNELRAIYDWPRGVVDQSLDDAAVLGKVRLAADEREVIVQVLAEEHSPCSVA